MFQQHANSRPAGRRPIGGTAILVATVAASCALGAGVAMGGAGITGQSFVFSGVVAAGAIALIAYSLEVQLIGLVRMAFIASFFFKNDITFFKIDELSDPAGFNVSITLFAALILFLYDHFFDDRENSVFPGVFAWLMAGLFVSAAVSVAATGATALGGFSLLSLVTSILIAYVAASHFGRRDRIVELVTGIGIGVLMTGGVALLQYSFGWLTDLAYLGTGTEEEQLGTQSQLLSRVPGFLRTPNGMAWVISSLLPIVIAPLVCRIRSFSSSQRMLLAAASFGGVVAIILSLARGSWLALVVAVFLMAAFGWLRLTSSERRGYFVSVVGVLALATVLLIPFSERIYDRLTGDDQGAAAVRVPLMENALAMIEDNPLTGVGLNGYRQNMTRYDETGNFVSQEFPQPVHNVFAHVTTEVGVIGGVIFCLLFVFAALECFKSMRTDDRLLFGLGLGAFVALVALVISGIKEPGSLGSARPPMRTCFLLLGVVMALSSIRRSNDVGRIVPEYA